MRYCFLGEHLSHIGSAGGITDERSTVANEGDGAVSCHLQALHKTQSHEVTDVQRVGGAVKADVKRGFAVIDHVFYLIFIGYLRDKPSFDQFFVNTH